MDASNRITFVSIKYNCFLQKSLGIIIAATNTAQFVGTRNIWALSTEHPYQITPGHISASSDNANLVTFFKVMLLINNRSRVRRILFTFEMKVLVSQETRHRGTLTSTGLLRSLIVSHHAHPAVAPPDCTMYGRIYTQAKQAKNMANVSANIFEMLNRNENDPLKNN